MVNNQETNEGIFFEIKRQATAISVASAQSSDGFAKTGNLTSLILMLHYRVALEAS
jgi:hypothetical protein